MDGREAGYVLGSERVELDRLARQADVIAPATELLLRAAGVAPGMRVLDLGTGLGHVAVMLGRMVGSTESVVGVDQTAAVLESAARRAEDEGVTNVGFVEADIATWQDDAPFDAIVARLVLLHLADPVAVVRHHAAGLRSGGLMVAVDFDVGARRAEPPVALVTQAIGWVLEAFRHAGVDPTIGIRLAPLLASAGLADVTSLGIQTYHAPDDPVGPDMLAGVVRALADVILTAGIATPEELDLDTLEHRIAHELDAADAVLLGPTLVGAWGRHPHPAP
jgi:ubiquinone/menaquinone biosynthesis C-methylase UbiE